MQTKGDGESVNECNIFSTFKVKGKLFKHQFGWMKVVKVNDEIQIVSYNNDQILNTKYKKKQNFKKFIEFY